MPLVWLKHVIAAGQDAAGFNLQTDGALDLAWDGACSDGSIPCIDKGTGADQYAPNTKLAELNTRLLADFATLDKFRFYGGWIETDAFVDMLEAAGKAVIEETVKGIVQAVITGGASIGKAAVKIGISAAKAYICGNSGPNDNNIQIVSAGTLSYLGLDTDSVVSLPSSLLLAPDEKLSDISLPEILSGKHFTASGNHRIFWDRDHSQMREPVDNSTFGVKMCFNNFNMLHR